MTSEFWTYTIFGLAFAGVYFIAASGLVVTYTASGIFNFAHGAVAMIAAFTYWELRVQRHWAAPLAFAAVLLVEAPTMGVVIERVVMRNLGGAATITNIVVSIGLLVTLLGIGSVVWAPNKFAQTPSLPRFYQADVVSVAGAPVPWHYFIVLGISAAVAFGLWTLLAGTRIGIAMRAVVDDRNLARLNGENPNLASAASWVVGCMLAALAGILLAPILALDVARLTLLVISAYAVAVVGRLRSLPLTALGAVILGLTLSYFDWGLSKMPHVPVWVQSVHDSLPIIMLFVVLLVLPQDRTRLTAVLHTGGATVVPTRRAVVMAGIAFVVGAWFVEALLHGAVLRAAGQGLAIAIVMLSLVLLTGYAGQISLAQLAFAGLGVLAASWLPGQLGASPVGLLVAAAFAGLVGVVIAVPCLRLRDIYLALGTMAFALVVEQNVLGQIPGFASDSKAFARWSPIASDRAYFVAIATVFVVLAWLVDRVAPRRVRPSPPGDEGQSGRLHDRRTRLDAYQGAGLRARGGHRGDRRVPPGGVEGHRRQGRLQSADRSSLRAARAVARGSRWDHRGVGCDDRCAVARRDAAGCRRLPVTEKPDDPAARPRRHHLGPQPGRHRQRHTQHDPRCAPEDQRAAKGPHVERIAWRRADGDPGARRPPRSRDRLGAAGTRTRVGLRHGGLQWRCLKPAGSPSASAVTTR